MKSKPPPSIPPPSKSANVRWQLLTLVILAELAYVTFFYSLSLNNAPRTAGQNRPLSRVQVAAVSIPGFLPETKSLIGLALERLTESSHLAQRVPILAWSALIVLAAHGVGRGLWILIRLIGWDETPSLDQNRSASVPDDWVDRIEALVFAQGIGMNAMSLGMLGLGLIGGMNRLFIVGFLVVGAVAAVALTWFDSRRIKRPLNQNSDGPQEIHAATKLAGPDWEQRIAWGCAGLAAAAFVAITLLGAVLPATDFDVREYHLQGPKESFQTGNISFSPHNVYCNMPFGAEMLTLVSMNAVGDWWWGALVGQVVLSTYGIFTALGIFCLGYRLFGPSAAWIGALIYLSTPWVYRISVIPYTENALAFYLLITVLAVQCAWNARTPRRRDLYWAMSAYFAGSAVACKYTALISTVLPLMFAIFIAAILRRRAVGAERTPQTVAFTVRLRWMAILFAGLLAVGPWLARNCIWTGNPTYPLLYGLFGGTNWTDAKNERWEWGHRVALLVATGIQRPPPGVSIKPDDPQHAINLHRLVEGVFEVTSSSDWLSPLLFAFAPLAILRRKHRSASGWLWLFVLYFFVQWWLVTHRLNRFWVPMLPVVAVLAGGGAVWQSHPAWRSFLWLLVPIVTFFNLSYCTTSFCAYNAYGEELVPRTDPLDPAINWMNKELPDNAVVLAVGEAALFHLNRSVYYNTVFDDSLWELWTKDRTPQAAGQELARHGITHVYVNWDSIQRYRGPGNYGYAEFVQPETFQRLVEGGILRRMPFGLADQAETVRVGELEVPQREFYELSVAAER